jgi:hypothetical protein
VLGELRDRSALNADQWNPLLKRFFDIANNASLSSECRKKYIRKILENG